MHLVKGDRAEDRGTTLILVGHEGIEVVEELEPGADKFVQKGARITLGLGGMTTTSTASR